MTSQSSRRRSRSGLKLPLWAVVLLALVGVIFLIVTSAWLFRAVVDLTSSTQVSNPNFDLTVDPTAQVTSGDSVQTSNLPLENQPFLSTDAVQRWSGRDRVTMLALGIDQRCDEEGPTRTDTMMVLTMDPIGLSASMLSLPRDLWVQIPGFGVDKINQAHHWRLKPSNQL
jgi:anionic cell wall polymer biosynthesis LytR-Cps2A-Psr (LCP) family protein